MAETVQNLKAAETAENIVRETRTLAARQAVAGGSLSLTDVSETAEWEGTPYLPSEMADSPTTLAAGFTAQLGPWSTGHIGFSGGVPVGGWAELLLFSNGNYRFRGHFHVSGAPSYSVSLVWGVKDARGMLYTFSTKGRLHGTFEPGSRDHNWDNSGFRQEIRGGWADLSRRWHYQWNAATHWDVAGLVNQIKNIVGTVSGVIAIVG